MEEEVEVAEVEEEVEEEVEGAMAEASARAASPSYPPSFSLYYSAHAAFRCVCPAHLLRSRSRTLLAQPQTTKHTTDNPSPISPLLPTHPHPPPLFSTRMSCLPRHWSSSSPRPYPLCAASSHRWCPSSSSLYRWDMPTHHSRPPP